MSIINENKIKKIATNSVLLATGLIFSYIDYLIPFKFFSFFLKIGLSNIIIIVSLFITTKTDTFLIGLMRVIIMSFLFANFTYFLLSIFSFIGSFLWMAIIYKIFQKKMNIEKLVFTMSIPSAIINNTIQVLVLIVITSNYYIFKIFFILVIEGFFVGFLIAILSILIIKLIKYKNINI